MRIGWVVATLGIAFALAARADAPTLSPGSGGHGRNFTLTGFGFSPVRKPVVQFAPQPGQKARKRVSQKVFAFDGTRVDGQVVAGVAGIYDVRLVPKDRGVAAVTATSPFEILLPAPGAVEPATGPVNSPVTITGAEFGSVKGKVTIGGKPAKVTTWGADSISVVVPKKLPAGAKAIVVTNKAGKSTAPLAYTVQSGSAAPDRLFEYDIGSFHFRATTMDLYFTANFNVSQDHLGVGASVRPNGTPSLGFNINGPALETPMPYDVTPVPGATGTLTATYADGAGSIYTATPGSTFQVTITAYASGVLEGTFSGDLTRLVGSGSPSVTVTNGAFKALVTIVGQ